MSPLGDDLEAAAQPDELDLLRARLHNAEAERNQARTTVAALEKEAEVLRLAAEFAKKPLKPPRWLRTKRSSAGHPAVACAMLSDAHFDEVIDPAEMGGYNAYNRGIAEQRLTRFFEGVVTLTRALSSWVTYEGAVLVLGGDLLSGRIHDLMETNESTEIEGQFHWSERIAGGVDMLAGELGRVHIPCTVGNHPRLTQKERTKRRVRDNFDWAISQALARHFARDDRVTFDIPDAIDVPFEVFDTRFLLNHGQVGGGGGIGGVWPPIMRLIARKMSRFTFDILVKGHHHQYIHVPDQHVISNGSLKGYDEYAAAQAFAPERAQQAFWHVTPEHGVTIGAPILVEDPQKEGWG